MTELYIVKKEKKLVRKYMSEMTDEEKEEEGGWHHDLIYREKDYEAGLFKMVKK